MNKTERDPSYYLETAPVPTAIAHMAVPMILSMVLDLIYNIVDAFFIGRLGDTAMLAAVTLAFPFFIVLMAVGQIFAVGGGTLIPRLLGAKDIEGAKRASSVTFYLALLSGFALMLGLIPFLSPILGLMGASGETLVYSRNFVLVLLAGSPFVILMMTLSGTIRGEGASTVAMTGMIASVLINLALDPVLIFALKMNVAGAALGTVIANASSVAYFVRYLRTGSRVQSVRIADFRPNAQIIGDILKVGMSAFLFSALMIVASMLFNGYAMRYGDSVVAAFGVANRLTQICEFLGNGLFEGSIPLIAFAYAAGNQKRLNEVLRATTIAFICITIAIGLPMYLFRHQVFSLFSPDPAVLKAGFAILQAMLVAVLFTGFSGILTGMFQAFGAGVQSNAMATVRGVALIPLIYLGNMLLGLGGVIWSLPAAEILSCLVGFALWRASRKGVQSLSIEARRQLVPREA
ncbi:MAG TPA: MATE family efflux transporter [Rectinemataceae bacterium]|nr:MATE family efflux transporter [Rectinemataceae bacterium]